MSAGRRKGQRVGPVQGARYKEAGAGSWLYNARLSVGMTQAELAQLSGVSLSTVIRYERPQARRRADEPGWPLWTKNRIINALKSRGWEDLE